MGFSLTFKHLGYLRAERHEMIKCFIELSYIYTKLFTLVE